MINKAFLLVILSLCSIKSYSQNKLFIYTENSKKGLVDENGNLKVAAEYDKITDLKKDNWTNTNGFLVEKDGEKGLMDYSGNWIYPLEYNTIFCQNDICKLTKSNKAGYGNIKGKLIIPLEYESLGLIKEGKISALKNGKWGYLNLKNEWIIKPQFKKSIMKVYGFSEGLAKVCLKDKENGCGYINETGKFIIPQIKHKYSGDFHSGLAITRMESLTLKGNEDGQKLVYLNKKGEVAFHSNWSRYYFSDYINGAVIVTGKCKVKYRRVRSRKRKYKKYNDCRRFLINTKGENILPKNCVIERSSLKRNYTIIRDTVNKKKGVVDNKGKIIVPTQYSGIGNFDDSFDWITVSNDNKDGYELDGFYNREGKKITNCKYQICGYYSDEKDIFRCINKQNGQGIGVLDKNGNEILPPIYGKVDLANDVFVVEKTTYIGQSIKPVCGYFNKDGSALIPMQYSSCSPFNDGLAVVLDKNNWKIIDKQNNTLVNLGNKYYSVSRFSNGCAYVSIRDKKQHKQKHGLINKKGTLIVPIIYDYIYHYNDIVVVSKNKKYGVLNFKGRIIIPLEYEKVRYSTCNKKVYGENDNKRFWYDLEGNRLSDKTPIEQCPK